MNRSLPSAGAAWQRAGLRVALAVFGGYAFTYAATAALARLLPLATFDAVVVATLLSFVIYLASVLWVFAAASLRRVLALLACGLPFALFGFWPHWIGGIA
ncbi:Iron uptake protein [Thauera humireducens]|uniref:iron transporter n=1 Tax=Thauera humireducens TaxID=1134435 RepID=UPI002467AB4C|nr:iron transporter [Thauera humireducens]CAH1747774.1 Iron uptake protein [Thauera humireducens]